MIEKHKNSWPNLFIAGAPRCGTTSLYEYLKVHPQIFGPDLKEPRYLVTDSVNFKGLGNVDYKMTVTDEKQYLDLYSEGRDVKYRMDGSPLYMYYPETAARIRDISDDTRVIISIRNPIDRAVSAYNMLWNQGKVKLSFEDFFYKRRNISHARALNPRGVYFENIENMINVLGRDRVHIIKFSDIVADTKAVLNGVYDFLDIECCIPEVSKRSFNSNKKLMKSSLKRRLISGKLASFVYPRLSKKAIMKIKKLITDTSKYDDNAISDSMKQEMLDFYIDDINNTEKLTGIDLSSWKSI